MHTQRRIGAIVSACLVASLTALAGLLVWLGPGPGLIVAVVIAFVVIATYVVVIGPWQRRWGATDEEVRRPMPGDELLRAGASSTTRAITIDRAPDDVFPWLLQIGYGRGGWYSYDWIDNDGKPSVHLIDPDLRADRRRSHRDDARPRTGHPDDRAGSRDRERRRRRLLVPVGRAHA